MPKDKVRQFLNLCLALAQPIVSLLVNLEITGPGIDTISSRYPTFVVPAGYAFSIWSLIFALCIGYGVWQALPSQRTHPLLRRVGWLTALAMFCTTAWMLTFQRSLFAVSLSLMFCLLVSLLLVVTQFDQTAVTNSHAARWLVYGNFSIFLGWITVATTANLAQTLTALRWESIQADREPWAIIALSVTGAAALFVTIATRGNPFYALTVIWGLVGVAVNQFTRAVPTNSPQVAAIATALSLLLLLLVLFFLIRSKRTNWQRLSRNETLSVQSKNRSYVNRTVDAE